MIERMFQEGTNKVLDDRVSRPVTEPPPAPSFGRSVWNTIKAPAMGVVSGANESVAFGSDMIGAFGQVQAGYGFQADPSLLFSPSKAKERREAGAAARQEIETGEAFSTELGTDLRATARSYMPDPATSNVAEDVLFGISRFATKAVGYSVATGPAVGATLTGIDEGLTEADRLKAQGVDFETRTKVGVVTGLSAAAATALPVAGRTIPQTVGLVAVGGPGGFIAQQAASRAILDNADYGKIADQYDPFDPVGLAVSTLVPAGFGAYAARGIRARGAEPAKTDPAATRLLGSKVDLSAISMSRNERVALRYDDPRLDAYAVTAAQREGVPPELLLALKNAGEKSNPNQTSPKGAQGVAQLMPENQRKYGVSDPQDPIQSIDGMAKYVRDTLKQYDGNVQAVIADYNGGPRQARRVLQGMEPEALETARYLRRVNDYLAERQGAEAGRALAADPEAVAAARVQQVRETVASWNLKDPTDIAAAEQHLDAVTRAGDQIAAGSRVDVTDLLTLDNLTQARMFDDMIRRLEAQRADVLPEAGALLEPGMTRTLRDEIAALESRRPEVTDEALRARAKEVQAAEGISYKAALAAARKEFDTRLTDTDAQIGRLEAQIEQNRRGQQATQAVQRIDSEIAQLQEARAGLGGPQTSLRPAALAVRQAVADMGQPDERASAADRVTSRSAAEAPAQTEAAAARPEESGTTAAAGAGLLGRTLDQQTQELVRLSPDMLVQLEGMETPMRLADALEEVRAQAARESADAPLLQVAAECFLRNA